MQRKSPTSVPQYGGRPISYGTDPLVLTPDQARRIFKVLSEVLRDVEDFTASVSGSKNLLTKLGLPQDLDLRPTPLGIHIPFARFDFLFDGENINILELNTDGTSGWNITEWLAEQAGLSQSENPNYNLSTRLRDAITEHNPSAPQIALADFPGINTSWEQLDLLKRFNAGVSGGDGAGSKLPSLFADPQTGGWKEGALIYRRVLSWQLRSQPEKAQALLKDWREGRVTVVGGWSSDVGMSKGWPAILKPSSCPETLFLDSKVVARLKNEKDNWIVKGALSYSGHAIFRGMDLKQERWNATLDQILQETLQGRPWIAQKFVPVPLAEGRPYELGAYFLNGKPSGFMCRWGHSDAISETSTEILRPVAIRD